RSSATYVRRTQYFICLLVVTLSRYSYPTRRSSDLAFRLTFHSAGNIAIRTNRQSPRRSRLPRNRRLTAERPNSLNPRPCELSGLAIDHDLMRERAGSTCLLKTSCSIGAEQHSAPMLSLLVHRSEEIGVRLRLLQLLEQELHGIDRAHRHEDAAEHPHLGKRGLVDQQLFLAGAGLADIDRREGPLVRKL